MTIAIEKRFSRSDDPIADSGPWSVREVSIKTLGGENIFVQSVRAPDSWSDQSVSIVAQKYLYGDLSRGTDPETGGRESSVFMLVDRVASAIADRGFRGGYFDGPRSADNFAAELRALVLSQRASFNSPVWFNVGIGPAYGIQGSPSGYRWSSDGPVPCTDSYEFPQASACFIVSVDDDMDSILERAKTEGMLFKHGSGVGANNSTLRSTREKIAGGGKPSGPLSFMRIYDAVAGSIKSGGKNRRAAKLETLKVSHPDIMEFIRAKPHEEKKAHALVAAGYSGGMDGEAATTVCFQNSNVSVNATDDFMRAAESDLSWQTVAVTATADPMPCYPASDIIDAIAVGTWECGDPGMLFYDTINRWHTCPNTSPIESANPCVEYHFINDSACNLASINLMRFRNADGSFNTDDFLAACRIFLIAQEILVDSASYPTAAICQNSHDFRPLGLGYCGLGSLLMTSGLPYDSEAGRSLAGAVTAIMHATAARTSAEMAESIGAFPGFAVNRDPMLHIMQMHRDAMTVGSVAFAAHQEAGTDLWGVACGIMDSAITFGRRHGYRNAQFTVEAPTGTIAFMMGSGHSTGIEPPLGLVQYKSLAGGGSIKIINPDVSEALRVLGYSPPAIDRMTAHVDANDTIEGSELDPAHLPVFDTAFTSGSGTRSIHWRGHVRMMAAIQPFLSGAISKSVNMPNAATVADIREVYMEAWRLGVKAIAIYRDGSKSTQPVKTTRDDIPMNADGASDMNRFRTTEGWSSGEAMADPGVYGQIMRILGEHVTTWDDGAVGVLNRLISSPASPVLDTIGKIANHVGIANSVDFRPTSEVLDELESRIRVMAQKPHTPGPVRDRLPDTRAAITHKGTIDGQEFYMTIGEYPDGRPGELFIGLSKEGSTIGGMMDAFATAMSLLLQYGVPLDILVTKFTNGRFPPTGFTKNPEIPMVSSIVDYTMRFMEKRYAGKTPINHNLPADYISRLANLTAQTAEQSQKLVRAIIEIPNPMDAIDKAMASIPIEAREKSKGSISADMQQLADEVKSHYATGYIPWGSVPAHLAADPTLLADLGVQLAPTTGQPAKRSGYAPICPTCGNMMNPIGPHCYICPNCRDQVGGCG